jgi:hypothetical protein
MSVGEHDELCFSDDVMIIEQLKVCFNAIDLRLILGHLGA